ncbi:MAG: NrfD/PsrC family molybdoenzyme membrane anchor subunit [Candidatus Geothermarchaeales archaeon]
MKKNRDRSYEALLLRPILHTGTAFYATVAVLVAAIGWFGYAWWTQLTQGLSVTGLGDIGTSAGAPWGLYITSFVWWVGIAYGCIAISAAVRIMKLEQYKPISRIAEVMTVFTLLVASVNIIFDLGRPDRLFNIVVYYWERLGQSPLVWDLTVIIGFVALSVTFLVLNMREDLVALSHRLPKRWNMLYRLVIVGYEPREREKVRQISWWLALSLLVLMAFFSGGVSSWLFGLMVSQPGWFSAVQGPIFLTAALSTAVAAVILVAAMVRHVFGWQEQIRTGIFRGLSKVLAVLILVYLWFILQEQITIQYAGPLPERAVSEALLFGELAPAYWTVIGGLILTFVYLAVQAIRPSTFSLSGTVLVSVVVLVVLWLKRFLVVVPSLLYPRLPYPAGSYVPTWVEWSLFIGTLATAALLYVLFAKIFPMMEFREEMKA